MKLMNSLYHFIGLFISGYGLKKLSTQCLAIYFSIAVQLFGFIVYSSPLSSYKLSHFADKTLDIFLTTLYLPLTTVQLMRSNHLDDLYLYAYLTISLLICVIYSTRGLHPNLLSLITIVYSVVAFYLSMAFRYEHDNSWLIHFNCLYVINHFSLPELSQKFSIPQVELTTVSLIFLNIFLINSFT